MPAASDPLARLLRSLDLEAAGRDVFRAGTGSHEGRMYGGLTVTQAVIAAGRTVENRPLHSLHAYFLRPGRHGTTIELRVERVREGRASSTRRVIGTQSGDAMFAMLASFARPAEGIAHQEAMPDVPGPEGLPDWESLRARALGDPAAFRRDVAMEVRVCDPEAGSPRPGEPARRQVWIRLKGRLPDDPLIHAAAAVFVTDRTLLRVGARPHGPIWSVRDAASLDHAVWLHRPFHFDDWVLYDCRSPVAAAGRALAFGAMYTRDGVHVLSVAQEGILRF
jgi:acyl-CoA thioesterase-2